MRRVVSYVPQTKEVSPEAMEQHSARVFGDMQTAIEGELELPTEGEGGNIRSAVVSVVFKEADKEVRVPHPLGRKPSVILPAVPSVACIVAEGTHAHDAKSIYLISDTADVEMKFLLW